MLLNLKNLILNKFIKKMNYKYYDLFEINKFIKKQSYRLKFFKIFRSMHNVFHVSLLKSDCPSERNEISCFGPVSSSERD